MGALHIYSRDPERDFDEIDRDLAHILAAQASVAIINARLVTQLRDVDEAREQFLSIVSHELRTPLTPLKALAQLQLGRSSARRSAAPRWISKRSRATSSRSSVRWTA